MIGDIRGNWFAVNRGVFAHHVVGAGQPVKAADPKRGSYSKLEAWLWIISEAAYEERRVLNKGREILINPGQLMMAHVFLAKAWNWTPDQVRWFLGQLERALMITREVNQNRTSPNTNQIQVLSVRNYSNYQILDGAEHQAIPQAHPKRTPSAPHEPNTLTKKQEKEGALRTPALDLDQGQEAGGGAQWAFDEYNALAVRCGLARASRLTDIIARGIRARLKEYGRPGWTQALGNIEKSAFLRGRNDRQWKADLGFMLQPKSFTKLHDGGYGNGAHAPVPQEDSQAMFDAFEVRRKADEERRRCGH